MNKTYYICVTGTPSDAEDQGVPGLSRVDVDLSNDPLPGQIAGAILDVFHDSVAISNLDDFDINVLDEDGREISQAEDYEERSFENIADFSGFLESEDAPDGVQAYFKAASKTPTVH